MTKKLYKSRKDKMIAGVSGGLAEYFDIDPVIIRAAFILAAFAWGLSILLYIVLWIIVPYKKLEPLGFDRDGNPIGIEVQDPIGNDGNDEDEVDIEQCVQEDIAKQRARRRTFFGIALILIGILFLIDKIFPDFDFSNYWPVLLLILGAYILLKSKKSE